eukprot:CAMPEP_0183454506 /NCGR_PEP_ID=MMETSP0370-20130417/124238_1 /TAXON_ID=268820 /ORGANISM="Peridinium aciculiferum, Strain PAER-2" /LENGTH=55 /DNA_ID=CAMNT_0025646017 /DNA_START=7 /DNA_END=170 /DNA_ORIENTATION=+
MASALRATYTTACSGCLESGSEAQHGGPSLLGGLGREGVVCPQDVGNPRKGSPIL